MRIESDGSPKTSSPHILAVKKDGMWVSPRVGCGGVIASSKDWLKHFQKSKPAWETPLFLLVLETLFSAHLFDIFIFLKWLSVWIVGGEGRHPVQHGSGWVHLCLPAPGILFQSQISTRIRNNLWLHSEDCSWLWKWWRWGFVKWEQRDISPHYLIRH